MTQVQPAGGDAHRHRPDGRSQVSTRPVLVPSRSGYTISDGRDECRGNVTVTSPSDGVRTGHRTPTTTSPRPAAADRRRSTCSPTTPTPTATPPCSTHRPRTRDAAGLIVPDPSGQVVFTPDPTHAGADRADGHRQRRLRSHRRRHRDRVGAPQDANNEPDARNDAGVTVVGKPIRLTCSPTTPSRRRSAVHGPTADPGAAWTVGHPRSTCR